MRSTRASAAVARLNARSAGAHYLMSITGGGLFILCAQEDAGERQMNEPLPLDQFVRLVDSLGPQQQRRVTRNDAAFERQLARKPKP